MSNPKTPDFTKAPTPEEARTIVSELGKAGAEVAENASIAEEAKAMSRSYTPKGRAGLVAMASKSMNGIGVNDASMPKELRDFSPGPRIMPTTEAGYLEKYDQETQFEKWQADERARQQAILDSERDAYQWYIRCRACYDHGVYLTHPIGIGDVLGRGDWYARYKPTPEAYWDRPLLCQWCLHKGSEVRLDVEVIDIWKHTFKPAARWLWKAAKDKDRFLIEGNIRAVLLPYGACNTQIEDIERRHELHKQWLAEKAEKEKEAKKIHG